MKLQKQIAILLALVAAVSGILIYSLDEEKGIDQQSKVSYNDFEFMVEVADTREERAEGLMHVEKLDQNEGMIFVYDEEDYRSFWMKNTLIPLDIIFLDSELEVINIEQADPEPNTSDENLASYESERPAQYVLEINQNRSEEIGLEEGSKMGLGLEFRG